MKFANRAIETCAAPGTGPITLLGREPAAQRILDKLTTGQQCFFCIKDQDGGDRFEVVEVTKLSDGTFSRQAGDVEDGTNGPGALVNFDDGVQDVWIDVPASLIDFAVYGYTHTQGTPSTTWTINHNLGKKPVVVVEDSSHRVVVGDITYTSIDSLTITFAASFSGTAYLN